MHARSLMLRYDLRRILADHRAMPAEVQRRPQWLSVRAGTHQPTPAAGSNEIAAPGRAHRGPVRQAPPGRPTFVVHPPPEKNA